MKFWVNLSLCLRIYMVNNSIEDGIWNPLNRDTFEGKLSDSSSSSSVNLNFPTYKKILVPHDGSEISDIALRHAIIYPKSLTLK